MSDLISPTMTPDEYLKLFQDKTGNHFEKYEPKAGVLDEIKELLRNKKEKLNIVALGAEWCPDCSRNVPRIIKIIKNFDTQEVELKILYGIMKNALHKPGETIWHKKRSPPEATDPKFDLKAIPTFYFFNNAGEYLDVIVENPDYHSTLEEDILAILKRRL
ncbi:MAG: thioredoxin family protein [Promethearchaeota archaeon]